MDTNYLLDFQIQKSRLQSKPSPDSILPVGLICHRAKPGSLVPELEAFETTRVKLMDMIIRDRVYGEIIITDPVIMDLLQSQPLTRLQHINQYGAHVLIHSNRDVTRYEHSLGVWYLLNRFNASRAEQVAGLLHDTPHTAFSHTVDFLLKNTYHSYHDQFTDSVICNSDIPSILDRHGIELEEVLHGQHELLHAELPDLSADRIDYFFRDTRPDQLFPDQIVNLFLDNLQVFEHKFVFTDKSIASMYALLYSEANRLLWMDPTSVASFAIMAEALREALDTQIVTQDDLWTTDAEVMDKMRRSENRKVKDLLAQLHPGNEFVYCSQDEAHFSGWTKFRSVDPLVYTDHTHGRVTELTPRIAEYFADLRSKAGTVYIKPKTL